MTRSTGIIRLNANGPDGIGLTPMTLDPADFASPLPQQNVHVAFEDKELGMSVGVWDTTTMQEAFGPYPGDEFILVLEGSFAMQDGAGGSVPAHKGQCVIFRNGMPVSWKQDGYLKKFYITYLDPRAQTPEIESAEGGVITMDPGIGLTDDEVMEDTSSVQRDRILFSNDHGNMDFGIWDTREMDTEMAPFPWHELCVVQEGEATITEEDGTAHHFGPGDVFFVPQGTVCSWKVETFFCKYYATLDANIRPGG